MAKSPKSARELDPVKAAEADAATERKKLATAFRLDKTYEELTAEEKDLLLRNVAIRLGMIKG